MTNKTVTMSRELDLFESILGKKPDAFLHEPVYQVTESEVLEFARLLAAPVVERQPVAWMALNRDGFPEKCLPSDPEGFPVYRSTPAPAELTVWEGAMPESNGKSNFTVILHTGDITEGICVYRSEYPGRARYEADCFRHLIGDPAFPEKPFICDYDADKHSGYVKPDTSPPAPVAVALDPCEWSDGQILDFLGVALRNVDLSGEVKLSEIRQGFEYVRQNSCLDKVKELNQ